MQSRAISGSSTIYKLFSNWKCLTYQNENKLDVTNLVNKFDICILVQRWINAS